MPNHFFTSDGQRLTQAQIDTRIRKAYDSDTRIPDKCEGCGGAVECHAHIIAKARCKQLRKTELIWDRENWFYACFKCNSAIENPKGNAWRRLRNIGSCLAFIRQHDQELYVKFTY